MRSRELALAARRPRVAFTAIGKKQARPATIVGAVIPTPNQMSRIGATATSGMLWMVTIRL